MFDAEFWLDLKIKKSEREMRHESSQFRNTCNRMLDILAQDRHMDACNTQTHLAYEMVS